MANTKKQKTAGDQAGTSDSASIKWLTAVNLLIAALNGFAGYWGFTNAKAISDFEEQAKKRSEAIAQIQSTVHYFAVKDIEKEIERLVRELPGLEFFDSRSKSLKEGLKKSLDTLESLEKDLSEDKTSEQKHLAQGILQCDQANYDDAIKTVGKIKSQIPEKYYILGVAYFRKNQPDIARQMFTRLRELSSLPVRDTLTAKAYTGEGVIAAVRGDYRGAIELFNKAIKKDPNFYPAFYNLAASYSRIQQYDASIQYICEYKKRGATDIVNDIDTDPDQAFKNLKEHLGKGWEKQLASRIESC